MGKQYKNTNKKKKIFRHPLQGILAYHRLATEEDIKKAKNNLLLEAMVVGETRIYCYIPYNVRILGFIEWLQRDIRLIEQDPNFVQWIDPYIRNAIMSIPITSKYDQND